MLLWIRRVLAALLVAGAFAVLFAVRPSSDVHDAVAAALADAEANNSRAEGAPQQTVVNGWAARDLLAIEAAAADRRAEQQSYLLAIIAIAVSLGLVLQLEDKVRPRPLPPVTLPPTPEPLGEVSEPSELSRAEQFVRSLYDRHLPDEEVEAELALALTTGALSPAEHDEALRVHRSI